jgi:hypothetical protein
MEELEFTNYVVTCETEDCNNGNISIEMSAPKINPSFVCGVCFKEITNIFLVEGSE